MIKKTAYLKGLADGLALDTESKEGKLILALIDLVDEMADTIEEMKGKMSDLEDYCEELDEDLGDVEEVLLGDDFDADDDEFDDDDFDDDDDDDDDDDEFNEEDYFEVICPSCGDIINFDTSIDPENLRCPNCNELFECIVDEDDELTDEADEAAEVDAFEDEK